MSMYTEISNKKSSPKKLIITFLRFGLISTLIGTCFMFFASLGHTLVVSDYLTNIAYSLLIGYGLFSFGFVFGWLERRYVSWINKPVRSLLIVLTSSTIYSSIVIIGVNWLWHAYIEHHDFSYFVKHYGYIMWIEFGVFYFIALWFYARSFFMEWRKEVENREKLKREALVLQYESLKTQVNPHFLFNSLNALTTLIELDVESAKTFTNELSCFYRDILQLKNKDLISIKEEMTIVKRFIYLQKIRFGNNFKCDIPELETEDVMVIPLSVQMLIENVFKHNIISSSHPVSITFELIDNMLIVSNTYIPKKNSSNSGLGLKNLNERTQYLTNKSISIKQTELLFSIHLPLIPVSNAPVNS